LQEGDVRAAVGVVLNALDLCGNIVFISLEIDDAVLSSVAAADMSYRDLTGVVAAARLSHVLDKASLGLDLGNLFVGRHRHETARGRRRFISLYSHFEFPPN
jgi:hypothetical protein